MQLRMTRDEARVWWTHKDWEGSDSGSGFLKVSLLSCKSPEVIKEYHETLFCPSRGTPTEIRTAYPQKYKSGALPTEPTCSVTFLEYNDIEGSANIS